MRRILLASTAFLLLLLPLTGSSLHEEELDLAEVVAAAERVAELRVLDRVCAVLPDGTIETRYSVALVTGLKGATAAIEELRLPGGEVGDHALFVPGLPRFAAGDRVVMFQSAPTARGWRMPIGLAAGAVRVLPGAEARVVLPDADGRTRLVDRAAFLAEVAAVVRGQED